MRETVLMRESITALALEVLDIGGFSAIVPADPDLDCPLLALR
jgi:hypothetical protein